MKRILALLIVIVAVLPLIAQTDKYQLSTHILDVTLGKPSANVTVVLEKQDRNKEWMQIDEKVTDENGRIGNFLPLGNGVDNNNQGIYRLTFLTSPYFESHSVKTFYPFVQVVFEITDTSHYHVPITLSPYGYSTYRGS
jgi:5-hydroxyisourate hydrolase